MGVAIVGGHITATSRGVEGLARRNPGNPLGPRFEEGANSSRCRKAWKMWEEDPLRTSAHRSQAEVFS
jgi:hypothetical protein